MGAYLERVGLIGRPGLAELHRAHVHGFSPEPSPFVDIEVSNWYVSTHPQSPFVKGIIVSRRPADGSVELLSDWSGELTLVTETPARTTSTPVAPRDTPELLATRFGLPGFEIGTDGRLGLVSEHS